MMKPENKAITLPQRPTKLTLWRLALAIILVLTVVLLLDQIAPHLSAAENWISQQGVWAPVFYVLLVCLLTLICFPMDVLFVAAGMIFGLAWGALYLVIATMLSQTLIFLVARHLLRHRVERWIAKKTKLRLLNRAIELQGARLLFLIRMAPIPASPISYLMGVSRMRFAYFLAATTGMLPVGFASMYLGYAAIHWARTASSPHHEFGPADIKVYVGLVAVIVGTIIIGHTARKALQTAQKEMELESAGENAG